MIIGTPYFVTYEAAERYYRGYGYQDIREAVRRKVRDREIYIGKPPAKPGERVTLNPVEGRYFIETSA